MKLNRMFVVLPMLALGVLAQAQLAPTDWPKFRHDLPNVGVGPGTPQFGRDLWKFHTLGSVSSSPSLGFAINPLTGQGEASVFVGSTDNFLYALDALTGVLIWKFGSGGAVLSSPALDQGGFIYFGTNHNLLIKLKNNGGLVWAFATGGAVESSPSLEPVTGSVYFGCNDGVVRKVSNLGVLQWARLTGGAVTSSPAWADIGTAAAPNPLIFIGSHDKKLYALQTATGVPLWAVATKAAIHSSPAVADVILKVGAPASKLVFVGSDDDHVYAYQAATGALVWAFNTGAAVTASPAIADIVTANGAKVRVVLIGSTNGRVFALNAATGAVVWAIAVPASVASSIAVDRTEQLAFFGSETADVYGVNAGTGALHAGWPFATGGGVSSSPAISSAINVDIPGLLYFGSSDGWVYAVR